MDVEVVERGRNEPRIQEGPGFETILALSMQAGSRLAEENYCPDCFDCNINCEECEN